MTGFPQYGGVRVLLVGDTFAPANDAAAETTRELCDALLAAGHEVTVVTLTGGNDSYRGARIIRLRRAPSVPALLGTVDAVAPDAVHVVRPRTLGAAALRALEHTDRPVLVIDPGPLHPRVGTALSSTAAGARLLAMVGVAARVWLPGVRSDEYHPGLRSAELHERWARATSPDGPRTVVGYAGPVGAATTKHVRRLARVAGHESLRLVVHGCGPGTSALKQAGARIVGECGGLELARGLASLDVFVQPRKHEAGLAVVRKALASGVPVVAFDTAVLGEVVRSGHNGLLVSPGQGRNGLRDAVLRLAGDPALREELASHARASVAGRSWADAAAELVEVCQPVPAVV